jgi:hypothetical protein
MDCRRHSVGLESVALVTSRHGVIRAEELVVVLTTLATPLVLGTFDEEAQTKGRNGASLAIWRWC